MHPARTLVESILPDDILVPVRAVKVRFNPRLGIGGYNVTINDVVACVALKPPHTHTHTHTLSHYLSVFVCLFVSLDTQRQRDNTIQIVSYVQATSFFQAPRFH